MNCMGIGIQICGLNGCGKSTIGRAYVVMIKVPKEIRLQRVRNRSFQKFGNRMLIGGDLYGQEEAFFKFVESRQEDYVESWVQTLNCPVIKIDGTKPVYENVEFIIKQINI